YIVANRRIQPFFAAFFWRRTFLARIVRRRSSPIFAPRSQFAWHSANVAPVISQKGLFVLPASKSSNEDPPAVISSCSRALLGTFYSFCSRTCSELHREARASASKKLANAWHNRTTHYIYVRTRSSPPSPKVCRRRRNGHTQPFL